MYVTLCSRPIYNVGHLVAMLRSLMVSKLGMNGDESTITEARKRFAAHCDGSCVLPADLRAPVWGCFTGVLVCCRL